MAVVTVLKIIVTGLNTLFLDVAFSGPFAATVFFESLNLAELLGTCSVPYTYSHGCLRSKTV